MMQGDKQSEMLDQAIAAVRDMAVPEEPSPLLLQRTRQAMGLARPTASPRRFVFGGLYARAVAAAAAILVILGLVATLLYVGSGSPVYAQIVKQIQEARTVSFDAITGEFPGDENLNRLAHVVMREPGLMRIQAPGGAVTIIDFPRGQTLMLFPEARVALAGDLSNKPEFMTPRNLMAEMKQVIDSSVQPLGWRDEGGRRLEGYQFARDGRVRNVWADARTATPVEIEIIGSGGKPILVFKNAVFDQPVSDEEFSLTPPAGYAVHRSEASPTVVARWPTEQDLVAALLIGAQHNGGRFPGSLERIAGELIEQSRRAPDRAGQLAQRVTAMGLGTAFESLVGSAGYTYVGGDVLLGDARRPVCWWKQGDSNRTVWGDLRITDEPTAPSTRPSTPRGTST